MQQGYFGTHEKFQIPLLLYIKHSNDYLLSLPLNVGIFLMVVMTCSAEISFVHSKWRSVPL